MGVHENIGAKPPRTEWTEERVELLRKLWAEGRSGSYIARQLGGVSRSAVIGKAYREGVARRGVAFITQQSRHERRRKNGGGPGKGWRAGQRTPKPVKAVQVGNVIFVRDGNHEPRAVPVSDAFRALSGTNPRPFIERDPGCCRWPIDGENGEFLCCNEPRVKDHPSYCWTHRKLAGDRSMKAADALANEGRKSKQKKL
ncbi:MAG TPA: GcrA family cell cycle regulator [Phenylobacterium sp.]